MRDHEGRSRVLLLLALLSIGAGPVVAGGTPAIELQLITPYRRPPVDDQQPSVEEASGDLVVRVRDTDENPLPEAWVELSGPGSGQVRITGPSGEVEFKDVAAGTWRLDVGLDGFSDLEYPAIVIREGRLLTLEVTMGTAVEETIVLWCPAPLMNPGRMATSIEIWTAELDQISFRSNLAAALESSSGIAVGESATSGSLVLGSEGRTSIYLDGFEVTVDIPAGQFDEVRFTPAPVDAARATAETTLDLVTFRGLSYFRGSAQFSGDLTGNGSASTVGRTEGELPASQQRFLGDRWVGGEEFGLEAGGPARTGYVWLWGAIDQSEEESRSGGGSEAELYSTDVTNERAVARLSARGGAPNWAEASWHSFDTRFRGLSSGPTRPPDTSWNRAAETSFVRLEDSHVFSSNFFVSASYGWVDGASSRFSDAVKGAQRAGEAPEARWDADGVWQDSFVSHSSEQSAGELKLNGAYFFATADIPHELAFGGRLRQSEVARAVRWPGRDVLHLRGTLLALDDTTDVVVAHRGGAAPLEREFQSIWIQDTVSKGFLTAQLGLRYDRQRGRQRPSTASANPAFPRLLPEVVFQGAEAPLSWETISPRLAMAKAFGEDRDTLLRLSIATFPEVLSSRVAGWTNPSDEAYASFSFLDGNGNHKYDDPEVDDSGDVLLDLLDWRGFDPASGSAGAAVNRIAAGLEPPTVRQVVLTAEHLPQPELVVGLTLTHRQDDDVLESRTILANGALAGQEDYSHDRTISGSLPDGSSWSEPLYTLGQPHSGGLLLQNGQRAVEYTGVSAHVVKRLQDRWDGRAYVRFGSHEWRVPESYVAGQDPTDLVATAVPFVRGADGDRDGELLTGLPGRVSTTGAVTQTRWQYSLRGMYRLGMKKEWGFNTVARLSGRQGTPLPYTAMAISTDGALKALQVTEQIDTARTPDIHTLDLRVEKDFPFGERRRLVVSLDALNLLDDTAVLRRELHANALQSDWVREAQKPRLWRLGIRFYWGEYRWPRR